MTSGDGVGRAMEACRRAGLPVVHPEDCTCSLRGRLVVLAQHDGLWVVWPYDQHCPIHRRRELERPVLIGSWPARAASDKGLGKRAVDEPSRS
jgi:hypothetical protein